MSAMRKFVAALRVVEGTISLGGCHTTLCLPCETSHAALSEEDRSALGLGADCFRCDSPTVQIPGIHMLKFERAD